MHGVQHDRVARFTTFPVLLSALITTHNINQSVVLASSYFISQYYLSPDLDLRTSLPTKRWGLFRFIWSPYQKLIGGHKPRTRNFWSHCIVLGISLRVLYLLCWIVPVLLLSGFNDFSFELIQNNSVLITTIYIGLIGGEIAHLIGDWLYSGLKKLF